MTFGRGYRPAVRQTTEWAAKTVRVLSDFSVFYTGNTWWFGPRVWLAEEWISSLTTSRVNVCNACSSTLVAATIYLLTAIGLPPGGSCTVHIYTQTIHRTTQNKQYIEQHKIWEQYKLWNALTACCLIKGPNLSIFIFLWIFCSLMEEVSFGRLDDISSVTKSVDGCSIRSANISLKLWNGFWLNLLLTSTLKFGG